MVTNDILPIRNCPITHGNGPNLQCVRTDLVRHPVCQGFSLNPLHQILTMCQKITISLKLLLYLNGDGFSGTCLPCTLTVKHKWEEKLETKKSAVYIIKNCQLYFILSNYVTVIPYRPENIALHLKHPPTTPAKTKYRSCLNKAVS